MTNSFLLPIHHAKNKHSKMRITKFYNEKYLVLLLLILSIFTICFILINLPSDIQKVVNRESLHNVFVPELNSDLRHQQQQRPMPILFTHKKNNLYDNLFIDSTPIARQAETNKSIDKFELTIEEKRQKIKEMTLFGWKNYEKYAWGENELRPLSKTGHSAGIFGAMTKLGATIVDGLDTIYLMGFMDEYERGREWIIKNLNINLDAEYSAFEINIRFIGGLLSIYTLTEDKVFLDKAQEIANALMPIFDTPTGIPFALVNPVKKTARNYNWASSSCSILAEFGTLSLEFQYLSDLTGNKIYQDKINKIFQTLNGVEKEFGLYYNYINPHTGKWCTKDASLGALGDSFYEYLLKLWLYKNKSDQSLIDAYLKAVKALKDKMLDVSSPSKLAYFAEFKSGYRLEKKMDHLACFAGGLLAMTAKYVTHLDASQREQYFQLGKNITNTCHESYIRTATRIGPERFHFERSDQEAVAIKHDEKYYILRPEVIESYFYMWRLTKQQKYREWAWDAAQAIEKHCRTEAGYSGLKDVYASVPQKDDVQQSFFFAETLKYLYLIFSDDDVLPLNKYVFNTEAHPFRIKN